MTHPRRLKAAEHWRALKAGKASAETLAWIADVARKVLEAEVLPADERRHAVYRAVELTGSDDPDPVAIRAIVTQSFGIEGDSAAARTARKAMHRLMLRWVLAPDLSKGPLQISDRALDERVRRALRD